LKARPLTFFALLYLFVLYAPILLLPLFAFNDGTVIAFPLQGFTLNWFGSCSRRRRCIRPRAIR
jgi:spermidine/putrescine transport system permease protein